MINPPKPKIKAPDNKMIIPVSEREGSHDKEKKKWVDPTNHRQRNKPTRGKAFDRDSYHCLDINFPIEDKESSSDWRNQKHDPNPQKATSPT